MSAPSSVVRSIMLRTIVSQSNWVNPRTPCTIARFCWSVKRRRFDRRSASCGVSTLAQILCSADGALTASNLLSKDRASGSNAPLPARFDTRPQHGSIRAGCRPLPRNDEVPSEILPVQQENQRARNGTRTKYPIGVQDSDAYPGRGLIAR